MTARIVGTSLWSTLGDQTADTADAEIPPPVILYPPYTLRDGLLLLGLNAWDGNAGTITPPSGFSAITGITNGPDGASAVTLGCFSKTASSEGLNYSYSWVNTQWHMAALLAIDGWDSIDIAAAAEGSSTAPQSPSVTTTVNDCLIIRGFVADISTSLLPVAQNDGSLTITSVFRNVPDGTGGKAALYGGAHRQAAAGASGTFTFSTASEQWRAFTIAIAPAGKAGGMSGIEVGA